MLRDLNDDLIYDSHCDWHSPELAALVAAGILPTGKALDVGCGFGVEGLFLARHGWRVVGIDSNPRMIDEAKRRRGLLAPKLQRRVAFRRADFTQPSVWPKAGSVQVVMERLLFTNLDARMVRLQPNDWYSSARASLIDLAASALEINEGVFIMRLSPSSLTEWRDVDGPSLAEADVERLQRYFKPTKEVGYIGMVTDPTHADDAWVVAPKKMSIMLWWRNGRRFGAASRR